MKKINVLTPISQEKLKSFLDKKSIEILSYFIRKSLFSQPEILPGQIGRAIQVPKEHVEQWFVQALEGSPVGSGSYPIDIYNENKKWGADIKMLNAKLESDGSLSKTSSGEASLGQKFKDDDYPLDLLFRDKKFEEIKNIWLKIFEEKNLRVRADYPKIKDIYYFFIMRAGTDFYLMGTEVNLKNLKNVKVKSDTPKSIFLENFIEEELGNTKVYKSKKRLELRVRTKKWIERDLALHFKTDFKMEEVVLRSKKMDEKFLQERFDRIKKVKIELA